MLDPGTELRINLAAAELRKEIADLFRACADDGKPIHLPGTIEYRRVREARHGRVFNLRALVAAADSLGYRLRVTLEPP